MAAKLDQIAAGIASGRVRASKKKRKAAKKPAKRKPAKRKKAAKRGARSRTESFLAKRQGSHAYHAPIEHTTVKQRSLYP